MAIIFFITVKANKDWYFNTHLTYLLKLLIDCKLIRGFFNEKYLKVGATPCHMAYSPISSFSVTLHALYLPCFLMLSSFSLNCLATSFSRFVKSNSTADTTSEGFGTCLKYLVVVDILTSCYSSVVCFDFDHLHQTWRTGRFEYLNTVVKECINEKKKMKPLHCKTILNVYCSRDLFIAMKMESSFTRLIGSRGWHVYQKLTWKNPKTMKH